MNYQKIYNQFISDRLNKVPVGYFEKHHILPKSLGGSDDKSNIIKLTAQDHYFAHELLAKIYGGKMSNALWMMTTSKKYKKKSFIMKEKKMNWFKKKFIKWVRDADETITLADRSQPVSHQRVNAKSSVYFTVYPASGGYVIEHSKQDRYKDNEGPVLTIVQHGEDLGKAVEHILALEVLKS